MSRNIYRFGRFSINVQARELRRDHELLKVSPKVFDCIVYLVENRERAVGRDELVAAVWSRADVAEAQLGHLMRKLRHTLGDNGEDQSIVHTIPRFGFRWVAALQTDPAVVAPSENTPAEIDSTPVIAADAAVPAPLSARTRLAARAASQRAGIMSGTAVLALLVIVAGGIWLAKVHPQQSAVGQLVSSTPPSNTDSGPMPIAPSIAVLPVTGDVGGDAEWIRLGLMDLIAGRLRAADLTVAPSADIVLLSHLHADRKGLIDRARIATGAGRIVVPTIKRANEGWMLQLELHAAAGTRVVEARAPDAILAARGASDHLLDLLGVPASRQPATTTSIAEVLQRAEAALLVDNTAGARRLIENAPSEVRDLPEAQLLLGKADINGGHPELARLRFGKLLPSLSATDDAALRGRVLTALGAAEIGQPETAMKHFTEAIRLLESLDEPGHLGNAYSGRGVASDALRRYEDASADYARARLAFSLVGDSIGLARIDNNEAAMAARRGRPADALPLLLRTAERFERLGALDKLVSPLVNQLSVYLDLLQPADALGVFRQNERRFDGLDNRADLHVWLIQGTIVLIANGKLREAGELLDRVTRDLDPMKEPTLLALTDAIRAELAFANGRMDAVTVPAKRAVDAIGPHKLANERASTWLMLLRAQRALHRHTEADTEFRHFTAWSRGAGSPVAAWYQALADAEEHMRNGRSAAGWSLYEETLRFVKQNGTPANFATVAVSYGSALISAGDLAHASTLVGSIGRWTERDYDCAVLQLRLYRALGRRGVWQSALENVRALAGERLVPPELETPPEQLLAPARP